MKIKKHINKIKDKITSTTFFETLRLIRKNKKMSAFIILIDIIAFSLFYAAKTFTDKLGYINSDTKIIIILSTYLFFAVLAYTFFKYIIIKLINSCTEKTELNLQKFWRFFTLNMTLLFIFFFTYSIIGLIIKYTIKPEYMGTIIFIALTIYSIIIYLFLNTSHLIFVKEQKIWKTIKETTKQLTHQTKTYMGIIISSAILILPLYLLYLSIALTAKYTIFTTNEAYYTHIGKFNILIKLMMFAFMYILLFINRTYFKIIVDKINLKS